MTQNLPTLTRHKAAPPVPSAFKAYRQNVQVIEHVFSKRTMSEEEAGRIMRLHILGYDEDEIAKAEAEKAARADETKKRNAKILQLQEKGLSVREIMGQVRASEHTIRMLLRRSGLTPNHHGHSAQVERGKRVAQASILNDCGFSTAEIAVKLNVTEKVVKTYLLEVTRRKASKKSST